MENIKPVAFAVNADVNQLIVAERFSISIWDTVTTECRRRIRLEAWEGVALSADGQRILTWSPGAANVMDLSTGERNTIRTGLNSGSWRISADGRLAVWWDDDVRVWDLDRLEPRATFVGESPMSVCAFMPLSRTIAACESAGHVHVLQLAGLDLTSGDLNGHAHLT
jgi:WD40 repeat protein